MRSDGEVRGAQPLSWSVVLVASSLVVGGCVQTIEVAAPNLLNPISLSPVARVGGAARSDASGGLFSAEVFTESQFGSVGNTSSSRQERSDTLEAQILATVGDQRGWSATNVELTLSASDDDIFLVLGIITRDRLAAKISGDVNRGDSR